jgi:hypothetical protein
MIGVKPHDDFAALFVRPQKAMRLDDLFERKGFGDCG